MRRGPFVPPGLRWVRSITKADYAAEPYDREAHLVLGFAFAVRGAASPCALRKGCAPLKVQLVLVLSLNRPSVQYFSNSRCANVIRELTKMKRFRRSRDDGRFALTTLQNPTLEVRSAREMIAAAEKPAAEAEACPPGRDAAAPGSDVPSEQNSAAPAQVHEPQPDLPEPPPQTRPPRPNPFPVRMEVRTSDSGEMEFRYVCGEIEPPPFAPIRDAATRARLAKYFADENAKAFRPALSESSASTISTNSPASEEITHSDESFTPPIPYVPNAISPDFSRHSRRCTVCAHPDRDAIEADFVRWRSPNTIANTYGLVDRAAVYRHAHATGLFARRKRETCRVLEYVMECMETCPANMIDTVIRATRAYAHMDDQGRWFEPPRTQYVIYGPPPTDDPQVEILTATRPHSKKARKP